MIRSKLNTLKPHTILAALLFLLFLAVGFSIYQDYGVSWDEPIQRELGYTNMQYMLGRSDALLTEKDRFYGPTFELFLILMEKVFRPAALREVFFLRHLMTFLLFATSTVFFYILSRNLFAKASTALLATIALILSPRIFDNAFYNTKDIPLLVFFVICFAFLFLYINTRRRIYLIALAVVSAVCVTVRILGVIIPLFTLAVLFLEGWDAPGTFRQKARAMAPRLAVYLLPLAAFTVLCWPILWSNPIQHFFQALAQMSHFEWDLTVLFMGKVYPGLNVPPSYPVVWILISTPIVYSVLFFIGCAFLTVDGIKAKGRLFEGQVLKLLLISGWFFIPLLAVIILKSTLYDSWRHLFFIYPAFLLLAFFGLERIVLRWKPAAGRFPSVSAVAYGLLAITYLSVAWFMVRAHPYQQVYFNFLAGRNLNEAQERFDVDYWGLSYRSGLEYISRTDPSPSIAYTSETAPGSYTFILPEADQSRLKYIRGEQDAKYILLNYRWTKTIPPYPEVYSVKVDGATILSVFKKE